MKMIDCVECMYHEEIELGSICWSPGCWSVNNNNKPVCGILCAKLIKVNILHNAVRCGVCGKGADKHEHCYICPHCGAIGDLMYGTFFHK